MTKWLDICLLLIYCVWIAPLSLISKFLGVDILDLKFSKKKDTYWINCVVESKQQ